MAWRRLLGDDLWARYLEPPIDEREIVRHYTLTRDDLDLIATKRTDATRLGSALLLLYLRWPGRALEAGEVPPGPVLAYVARQLGVPASAFDAYAARDATRRAHLVELMRAGGYASLSRATAHEMIGFLATPAQTIVRPGQLAGILAEELRRRRVLLPSPLVLEAVIRGARLRAERLAHEVLTAGLDAAAFARLDGLLEPRPKGRLTWLSWLRNAPQSPAPANVVKLIKRIEHVRALGVDRSRASSLPAAAFDRLAEEAGRVTARHLAQLNPARRHAVLAAAAITLEMELTDGTLAMFEKLMASLGRTAERKADERAARSMREVQIDLRVLAAGGRAMVEAQEAGHDVRQAVEAKVGWERYKAAIRRAEAMAAPEALDPTADLVARHRTVRSFGPVLLSAFAFEGSAAVEDLMAGSASSATPTPPAGASCRRPRR
jgi:hypothetical protein